jgi:hypothetical protein
VVFVILFQKASNGGVSVMKNLNKAFDFLGLHQNMSGGGAQNG